MSSHATQDALERARKVLAYLEEQAMIHPFAACWVNEYAVD
jgi:hypothetical protein